MKKISAIFMAAALAVCMTGCVGPSGNGGTGNGGQPPVASDHGTLSVADTYAWIDYPAVEFVLDFSKPDKAEALEYEYDDTKIELDETAHTVRALAAGKTTVKATSEHFQATFEVTCEEVNKDREDKAYSLSQHANGDPKGWDSRVKNFENDWNYSGSDGVTTLFIGDSFFDVGFWKSFYGDYSGKDALCWGIGSTTTCSWETVTETLLYKISPKNVVMHIGTNNNYDLGMDADELTSSLERLFALMHDKMPDTKMYWFNITRRFHDSSQEINRRREATAEEVNARFTAWAQGRPWLTVIDTRSKLIVDKILSDGVHPNADGYEIFVEELAKTDIKIYNK